MSEFEPTASVESLLSHRRWVRALARSLVRDPHRAADLEQDLWVGILERPPGPIRSVKAWLARTLRNRSHDIHRSETARRTREESAGAPEPASPIPDLVAQAEAQQRIAAAVVELPEPIRTTVLLRFFEELSVREIGRRMGVPYETARARLARGLAILKGRLDDEYGGKARALPVLLALGGLRRPAAVTGAAAATVGGVILATKAKIGIGVVVILLLAAGAGVWSALAPETTNPRAPEAGPVETSRGGPEPADESAGDPAAQEPGEAPEPAPAADKKADPKLGACHGTLTFDNGEPVAFVPVRLSGTPSETVITDEAGRFRIENAWVDPTGRGLWVGPKTGAVSAGSLLLRPGEDITFDACIPVGRKLRVEVVSLVPEKSVRGVWVILDALDEHGSVAVGILTGDGIAEFDHLPAAKYGVRIDNEGWERYREVLDLMSGLAAPEVLRIRLGEPEKLTVRVNPPPEKKYLVNLSLLPGEEGVNSPQYSYAGDLENGVFTGDAPPAGEYRAYLFIYGLTRRELRLEVREREPVEILVEMDPGVEVGGTVVGPDGEAIAASVTLNPMLAPPDGSPRSVRTDGEGRFSLKNVPVCQAWVGVRVGRQRISRVGPDLEIGPGGLAGIEIRLEDRGTIRGRIEGAPRPGGQSVQILERVEERWTPHSMVEPAKDGSFVARFLPAGPLLVRVEPMYPEDGWAPTTSVDLKEGETVEDLTIGWQSGPEVELVVTSAGGAPVTEILSCCSIPDVADGGMIHWFDLHPDDQGRVRTRSIAPGRRRLQISAKGQPNSGVEVTVEIVSGENPPIPVRLAE